MNSSYELKQSKIVSPRSASSRSGRVRGESGGSIFGAWGLSPRHAAPATFQNPLFAGDFPDPTILRVGQDFYMTHTSYSYAHGLVVWHSRGLVNWTPISHALKDADNTRAEVWSPDLVEHQGRYYIYFPMGGIFVVHAEHPSGPWSAPIDLKLNDIDPAHVAGPDGKRCPDRAVVFRPAETAWLKLVNRKNRVEILASTDGQNWQSLITDFDVSDFDQNGQHGGFQAARPALAASGVGSTRFTGFRYKAL